MINGEIRPEPTLKEPAKQPTEKTELRENENKYSLSHSLSSVEAKPPTREFGC